MPISHIETLRDLLRQETGVLVPGAPNALAARIVADIGFSLVLYANAALRAAVHGMQTTLSSLKKNGVLAEDAVTSFAERQRLVGKPAYDALKALYATATKEPD